MRFVRYERPDCDQPCWGEVEGTRVHPITNAPYFSYEYRSDEKIDLSDIHLLAPVEPSKIICVGLNYHAHVDASYSADKAPERPLLFFKPPSSIIGPDDTIVLPAVSKRVDYEAELGIVIGKKAVKVSEDEALSYLYGYTCVNDVTARDLQKIDKQWARAKGFDTFCPVGPELITDVDYSDLLVEGILNETAMQSGRTSQMIFSIPFIISYISQAMTLMPGDLISTGTPAGISPMKSGDKIEVRIEKIGRLINSVS